MATAALLAVVLAAACSDDAGLDRGPPAPAQVVATASATTDVETAEKPVVTFAPAAQQLATHPAVVTFRAYQDAYATALFKQDPNYPPLLATTTGRMLAAAQARIREFTDKGWVMHGAALWSILGVREESGTKIVLQGCHWYSSTYALDPATGKPAGEIRDEWVAADIELTRSAERLQVEAVRPVQFPCTDAVRS